MKIKKGDKVKVITGKDKGKIGEVTKVIPSDMKIVVSGVNLVKKHTKASKTNDGGIITKELPIHVSNVAYFNEENNNVSRLGFKFENEKKFRFLKSTNKIISN